ncbi:MAG: hypothetical protein RR614_02930, partial [Eubacterium sp.]
YGCDIEVHSDSKNNVDDKTMRNRRISRWLEIIGEYTPTIIHIKGNDNFEADGISRLYKIDIGNQPQIEFKDILNKHEEDCHAATYKLYKTLKEKKEFKNITRHKIKNVIKYYQIYKNTGTQDRKTNSFKTASDKNYIISSDIFSPFMYQKTIKIKISTF